MAKGEIACFEQFLLLSLCFQKAALTAAEASESVYMRERVKTNRKWKIVTQNLGSQVHSHSNWPLGATIW